MSNIPDGQRYRALVVGCGSIGRRHAKNLKFLGVQNLALCDTNADALNLCAEEVQGQLFSDYLEALSDFKPDMTVICTPPVYHVEEALEALRARSHVFIEKPLSHESSGIEVLIAEARHRDRNVQIGYNMRFHPGLKILKDLIDSGKIGRVLWLNAESGQYLPDWRPWQNYRDSYSARKDLGGGIILDGSHELDYICWLLGGRPEVSCRAEHLSSAGSGCRGFGLDLSDFSRPAPRRASSGFCAANLRSHLQGGWRERNRAVGFQFAGSAVVLGSRLRHGEAFRINSKSMTCT
jgi:predicted dehydrogenase